MAKISLAHGVEWGAEFLRQRNLQSNSTTFSWLKFLQKFMVCCVVGSQIPQKKKTSKQQYNFCMTKILKRKLFNLLHLNKTNINMNLNTQI